MDPVQYKKLLAEEKERERQMQQMLKEYGGDVGELGGGEVDPEMAELEAELKRKEKRK